MEEIRSPPLKIFQNQNLEEIGQLFPGDNVTDICDSDFIIRYFELNDKKKYLIKTFSKNEKAKIKYISVIFCILIAIYFYIIILALKTIKWKKQNKDLILFGKYYGINVLANELHKKGYNIKVVYPPYRKIDIERIENSESLIIKNHILSRKGNKNLKFQYPIDTELSNISNWCNIPFEEIQESANILFSTNREESVPLAEQQYTIDYLLFQELENIQHAEDVKIRFPILHQDIDFSVDMIDEIIENDGNITSIIFSSGNTVNTKKIIFVDELIPDELVLSFKEPMNAYCKIGKYPNTYKEFKNYKMDNDYKLKDFINIKSLEKIVYTYNSDNLGEILPLDNKRVVFTGCKEILEQYPINSKLLLLSLLRLPPSDNPDRDFLILLIHYANFISHSKDDPTSPPQGK